MTSHDTEQVRYRPLSYRETLGFKQSHFYGCDNFIKINVEAMKMEGIKRRSLPFRFHHYLALCCISTFSVNNLRIICFNFFDRQVW